MAGIRLVAKQSENIDPTHETTHMFGCVCCPPYYSAKSSADSKKYEATSDIMAESEDAPAVMEVRTHYGELQQIFRVRVPQSSQLHLDQPQTLYLAAIKDCDTSFSEDGFWEFKTAGKLTVVDLGTIQCTVGRIYDRGKWVIIDRSGDLAHINIGDGGEVSRWNLTGGT
jgi:hypothetical protein